MADARYLARFSEWFDDYATTLTWCRAASPEDVLTVCGVTMEQREPAHLADLYELRLLAGRLGNGTLLIESNSCTTRDTLTAIAQYGPCLSVQWSDFAPPGVTYAANGRIVVSFDPFDREDFVTPDPDSVEEWISTSLAGSDMWNNDWPLAVLVTAEALCEGVVDEEWVRATHMGVRAQSGASR